jgi:serine/threonine-protein kinase
MDATDPLDLGRFRFTRPETEADYRRWQSHESMPFVRWGMVAAIVSWVAITSALPFGAPSGWKPIAIVIWAVQGPLIFLALWMCRGPARPSLPWLAALINATSGWIILWLGDVVGVPELSTGAVAISSFYGFAVFRLRLQPAIFAVSSYLSVAAVRLTLSWSAGSTSTTRFLFESVLMLVAFQSGLLACFALERASRLAYRQEHIIEAQRRALAEERARSESLLKQELSHQVAARSRELGRLLARTEPTLLPGRPRIGARFDTRYRVERELGAGAMGAVYEVERITDGQRLALKVVTGEVSPDRAARFAREAEIGARVRHPNVVEIVDVGVADGGVPYLAMELVSDGSIEEHRDKFGDVAWARPILAGIAAGLAALHDAGVVHRDLKPANVLLIGGKTPKISDFGISRFGALDTLPDPEGATLPVAVAKPTALTVTGMLLGTPYYMAPETVRGAKTDGLAVDVFAFGIIAVEMLTGRPPFTTPAVFRALAGERLEPPSAAIHLVDPKVRHVLLRCLEQEPAQRPSMKAVVELLET